MDTTNELLIDAELEIEIEGLTQEGVNLKLRLRRDRNVGLREDTMNALFNGIIIKEDEFISLPIGSIILFDGIRVPIKISGV